MRDIVLWFPFLWFLWFCYQVNGGFFLCLFDIIPVFFDNFHAFFPHACVLDSVQKDVQHVPSIERVLQKTNYLQLHLHTLFCYFWYNKTINKVDFKRKLKKSSEYWMLLLHVPPHFCLVSQFKKKCCIYHCQLSLEILRCTVFLLHLNVKLWSSITRFLGV